jgi:RNA polymerase sigma factor (TIGR02999 family)
LGPEQPGDLTAILNEARSGGADARERLVRAIYAELRRTAGGLMRRERPGHTLQPSALVHEALLRFLDGDTLADVPNRRHLIAAAAQAMRQVLVDHAGAGMPGSAAGIASESRWTRSWPTSMRGAWT